MSLPFDDGFTVPAEWADHARCWMAWPTRAESWGEHLDAARDCVAELANAVAEFEPVSMIAKPKNVAEVSLVTGSGVSQVSMNHDDCWIRDMGPSFIAGKGGELAGVYWRWNAWGHRFEEFERDAAVAEAMLDQLGMRRYQGDLVLEGGAIGTDGEGTLITSESVLLNPNRNPNLTKEQVEEQLIQMLGVRHIIWLGEGLQDDMRGGQVENLARFIRPGVVVANACSDPADPNHKVCTDNLQRLRQTRDAAGRELEIIEIEQPRPRFDTEGRRLALSYVNFYMANGAVIMPAFEDGPADKRAYDIASRIFPKREIVQLPSIELAFGGGGIHSICLPQPAGTIAKPL
ncbi:agmatine/peptidylarginine deiminase [Dongia sp.]|uniref:agmatine deiminase family protein n=1 Tax=Dongia sp. TaxID=1977262 RepID=UPI0035B32E1E